MKHWPTHKEECAQRIRVRFLTGTLRTVSCGYFWDCRFLYKHVCLYCTDGVQSFTLVCGDTIIPNTEMQVPAEVFSCDAIDLLYVEES